MASQLYINDTPAEVKNAKVRQRGDCNYNDSSHDNKGLHLITQSTPNGQKVQIFLEELADAYGTEWTTTLMSVLFLVLIIDCD
jgi:glutathione S-transferase